MVRSSFAILFFIRESRVRKNGTTSIEVVLTVNGERCSFSTGKKIKVTSWDKNKQLVKGKDEEATSLNNYLKSVKAKLSSKNNKSYHFLNNFQLHERRYINKERF